MNTRRKQGGITLLGFIIVAGVAGFFVFIGIKLFPMYSEYYSVKSALKGLAAEPGVGNYPPGRIQELFFRRLNISYSSHVKKEHVKIQRVGEAWQMDVTYEVREPLVANLDAVGRFHATQLLSGSGADPN
ncbi:DUF4845 domain-containing protein [Luteimonas kalidii]|uniref:DUF4845 domain-containing protein n=1 Tax=Luteimonas kalidii TaxID=3042025 RepID=A0ABT6JWA2_9GAMM|nr:DUF4845 domain-containing protein [Luteimonas kalidii]MDH5834765.1 DUF4845 domain-containing protein [Luteimonas kalidii]